MFEKLEITRMAQAMAANAGSRMGVVAANIAHADTPGYRAMDLPDFAQVYTDAGTRMRTTRPGHLGQSDPAGGTVARPSVGSASPNGNTVSLEQEMVKMVEVRQQHEMALAIYRSTSGIIRASLGRGAQG
jgi:flagellar basal-body rod protein FlgB